MAGSWIAEATKNKGGLHRSLGIAEGNKIPYDRIVEASKGTGKVAKQAHLALTLRKMHG